MSDETQEPQLDEGSPLSHKVVDVALFGFVAMIASVCLLTSAVGLAEGLGPSRIEDGTVLERSVSRGSSRTCRPGRVCRSDSVRAGTVLGEFANGDQWIVANTAAYDDAPPADAAVEVETSLITRRVSGFTTPGQPGNSWSSTGEISIKIMIGLLLLVGLPALRLGVSGFAKVRPQPGRSVPAATGLAIGTAIGAYGVWSLLFAAVQ